jgi:hypothetical protein
MGSYSDSVTNNSGYPYDFFTSLTQCLTSGIGAVKDLALLNLSIDMAPDQEHPSAAWTIDRLLAYKGVPLLAVAIRVEVSTTNRVIKAQEHAKPGQSPTGAIKKGFQDRLKAADALDEPIIVSVPKRVMTELLWRITLRLPSNEEKVYTGDCFDFSSIEAAFDAIADVVEAAIRDAKGQP